MTLKHVEKKDKNTVELEIEVGKEEFAEAINAAYKKNAGKLNVPGFRKGKAPRKLIESMYGEGIFYEDAVNSVYPNAYSKAVLESGIDPVDRPVIDILDVSGEGFRFTATVIVAPEVTLKKYKGLEAERLNTALTEKEINAEIELVRKRNARLETVSRPIETGDTAIIDFEGFRDGVAFDGGKGEKYSLAIGSGQFVPGFEEQMVGMSAGENREVNITFPDNYVQTELAGKPALFKVFLHEVKESILPELDDEFAKDVSEFDTLEEYKKSVAEDLESKRQARVDELFENSIIDALVSDDNFEADIPEVMISQQIHRMTEEFGYRLMMQGINMTQYMKMMNIGPADMEENFRDQATRQVKTTLCLSHIAKLENFEISDEELAEEYNKLAAQYNMGLEQVKEFLDERAMRFDLKNMKSMYLIRDNAIAKEPSPDRKTTGGEWDSEKSAKPKTTKAKTAKPKAAKETEKTADDQEKPKRKTTKKKETTETPETTE